MAALSWLQCAPMHGGSKFSQLNTMAMRAYGSLYCSDKLHQSLASALVAGAMFDKPNCKICLDTCYHHRTFFSKKFPKCQANMLLMWLLNKHFKHTQVLCDAMLYEQGSIGDAVPLVVLHILCRLLINSRPICILDIKRSKQFSNLLLRQFLNTCFSILSVEKSKECSELHVRRILSHVYCMPLGFTVPHAWQAGLPNFISLLLTTALNKNMCVFVSAASFLLTLASSRNSKMRAIYEAEVVSLFPTKMPTMHNELIMPSLLLSRDVIWKAKKYIGVEISKPSKAPNMRQTSENIKSKMNESIFEFGVYALLALLLNRSCAQTRRSAFTTLPMSRLLHVTSGNTESLSKRGLLLHGMTRFGMHRLI